MSTAGAFRGRRGVAFGLVAAACLLASHDLIFLVQLGPGRGVVDTLRTAGHGYWPIASAAIAVAGLLLVARAGLRLRSLGRGARGLTDAGDAPSRIGPFLHGWMRLLVVVGLAFLVQENVEHFVSHAHAPLLGALAGLEYPLALPLLAAMTLVGAMLVTLVRERERVLLARIARGAARTRRATAPAALRSPDPMTRRRMPILARPDLSRAPPFLHS